MMLLLSIALCRSQIEDAATQDVRNCREVGEQ
jgi:hypothetical protein